MSGESGLHSVRAMMFFHPGQAATAMAGELESAAVAAVALHM